MLLKRSVFLEQGGLLFAFAVRDQMFELAHAGFLAVQLLEYGGEDFVQCRLIRKRGFLFEIADGQTGAAADMSGIRGKLSREQLEQRRLAAAVASDQSDPLFLICSERDSL